MSQLEELYIIVHVCRYWIPIRRCMSLRIKEYNKNINLTKILNANKMHVRIK